MFIYELVHKRNRKKLLNKMSAQKKIKKILKQSQTNYYSAVHRKLNDQREETL